MERPNNQFCADAGGKFCPCHLGKSGDCIKCSLIGEKKLVIVSGRVFVSIIYYSTIKFYQ